VSDFALARRAERSSTESGPHAAFSILTVCTGNICRSPAAERMLAQKLGPTVSISSAGTHALVGQPISQPMAKLLRNSGAEDGAFAARLLTEKLVEEADLVLALTRGHRSLVVGLWPPAVRRTFTLREFARMPEQIDPSALPHGTPAERLRAAIPLVVATRGLERISAEEDDVVDPYRRGDEIYAASFAEITAAVNVVATIAAAGSSEVAFNEDFAN
jgi:protein-tyrosine phosphatase